MDLTDPSAFARVYDEHSPGVYRAAYGIVRDATMAQDVTQDVFLRLWRRPRTSTPVAARSARISA